MKQAGSICSKSGMLCSLSRAYIPLADHFFRYREDPKTGLPTPYYGPLDQPVEPTPSSASHAMMGLHSTIDPQLMTGHSGASTQDGQYHPASESSQQTYPYSPSQAGPSTPHTASQSFSYLRSTSALPHRSLHAPPATPTAPRAAKQPSITNGQRHSPFPEPRAGSAAGDSNAQATQAITQLTAVTESLLGVCSSLKELLQQQVEESKARTDLMRAEAAGRGDVGGRDREKEISIEKVNFATEILKTGPQNEDIKKAAIECLTKYLMRDL